MTQYTMQYHIIFQQKGIQMVKYWISRSSKLEEAWFISA